MKNHTAIAATGITFVSNIGRSVGKIFMLDIWLKFTSDSLRATNTLMFRFKNIWLYKSQFAGFGENTDVSPYFYTGYFICRTNASVQWVCVDNNYSLPQACVATSTRSNGLRIFMACPFTTYNE